MIGTGGAARGQVDHGARRQLAQTLEQTGPLTVRGLARETKRTQGWVRHHLRVLLRAGAVAPVGGRRATGQETTYALTPERMSDWARGVLRGELSMRRALQLMAILMLEAPLTSRELAARTGLSPRHVERYMEALRAEGWARPAEPDEREDPLDRLRDYPERFKRWLRATAEGDDEEDEERKSR